MKLRPALFLDRDGVINEEVHYLWRPEECRLVNGIVPLLQTARRLGYVTVVVTNQAGIGRGMYTEADFHRLMDHIIAQLEPFGAYLDAVYFSPFHPEHGNGEYRRETDCRKPGPGMLLRAAEEHGLDLRRSVMVGDRCTDIAAGAAAGVTNLILFDHTEPVPCVTSVRYSTLETLESVTDLISALGSGWAEEPSPVTQPATVRVR